MNRHAPFIALLCAATPFVRAQDEGVTHTMPDPKHAAHEALSQYVGTWHCKMTVPAMPGQQGMEEPTEYEVTETGELLCNGIWLKWTSECVSNGKVVQGLWLVGYDPFAKKYTSFCLDGENGMTAELDGSYDASKKSWSWSGKSEMGSMTSEVTLEDADTMVEVVRMTPHGASEPITMTMTRKRAKTAAASASRGAHAIPADLPAEQKELLKLVGEWDAVVKMAVDPTQPASEEKGSERVTAVCNHRFVWSDFRGTMMGQPFEGHCVIGFDPVNKQYVSYWFDSMSPTWSKSTGKSSAENLTLEGSFLCPLGTPMTMKEVITWKDADTREARMEFSGEHGTQKLEVTYRRKGGAGDKADK